MFKTENRCKTPQVVGAIDGTHDFIRLLAKTEIFSQYTSYRGIQFAIN